MMKKSEAEQRWLARLFGLAQGLGLQADLEAGCV